MKAVGQLRGLVLVLLVPALAIGCKKDGESGVTLTRSGEAPAVVEVEGSAQLDLGSAKEAEPNNEPTQATLLELPVSATGVLTSSDDVDVFAFVSPVTGHAKVHLRAVDGADLMLEASGAGSDIPRVADRGPATSEGFPNLPVVKGGKTFIAVKEYLKKSKREKGGRKGDSPPYELEISIEPPAPPSEMDRREAEPNDTAASAKTVLSGDSPSAYIGWANDVDFYKLSLEGFTEKDLIEISLDAIDGVTLGLELSNPDGESVLKRKGEKSAPIYVRGLRPGGAEHFIAKVTSKRSHESQRYRFHFATKRLTDGDEVEPNDSAKQATSLGGDDEDRGEVRGEIYGTDVDWYVLPTSKTRRDLDVTIEWSGTPRLEVDAIAGGDSLGTIKGDRRDIQLVVDPKMRLRLKVHGKGGSEPAEYTLTWKTEDVVAPVEIPEPDPLDMLE